MSIKCWLLINGYRSIRVIFVDRFLFRRTEKRGFNPSDITEVIGVDMDFLFLKKISEEIFVFRTLFVALVESEVAWFRFGWKFRYNFQQLIIYFAIVENLVYDTLISNHKIFNCWEISYSNLHRNFFLNLKNFYWYLKVELNAFLMFFLMQINKVEDYHILWYAINKTYPIELNIRAFFLMFQYWVLIIERSNNTRLYPFTDLDTCYLTSVIDENTYFQLITVINFYNFNTDNIY